QDTVFVSNSSIDSAGHYYIDYSTVVIRDTILVSVDSGQVLEIGPGTTLLFDTDVFVCEDGRIKIAGTSDDSVKIITIYGGAIYLWHSRSDNIIEYTNITYYYGGGRIGMEFSNLSFSHNTCFVEGGMSFLLYTNNILEINNSKFLGKSVPIWGTPMYPAFIGGHCAESKLVIHNTEIDSFASAIPVGFSSNVTVTNTVIHNCGTGIIVEGGDTASLYVNNCNIYDNIKGIKILALYSDSDTATINYCNFWGNDTDAVNYNLDSDSINMEYNWWGENPPDTTQIIGNIDYIPWLSDSIEQIQDSKLENKNNPIIFPNPAVEYVNVSLPDNYDFLVGVIDILGKRVLSKRSNGEPIQISGNNLSSGVYYFHIYDLFHSKSYSKKVIFF
ncbi:hypothetical protein DRQ33_07100, partial [bacterium]